MFKNYVQKKLEQFVVRYFQKHPDVKLVVVAGSVGKTSAKHAIATILSQKYRVRLQEGNHNTHMSVPLSILGIGFPTKVKSVSAWLEVFSAAKQRINQPAGVDVIIAELGTDKPGDIAHFGTYLRPHIAVITAVTEEHMEFFQTIEKVAEEELTAANFSGLALINRDDIDGEFAKYITNSNIDTYGTTGQAEYHFEIQDFNIEQGYVGNLIAPEFHEVVSAQIGLFGEHSLRPVMAGVTVAIKLGLAPNEIVQGLTNIKPVPGRMNILRGVNDSILIDDTYNSSPAAAASAIRTLYSLPTPQRIAILGSMNELGAWSQPEHQKIGEMCDINMLDWVVTVGEEAEKFLAPAAHAKGCQVKSFRSSAEAGGFVHSVIEKDAIVLAKGSQGGIFVEEALKPLLHSSVDNRQLVRQSSQWMAVKQEFFAGLIKTKI